MLDKEKVLEQIPEIQYTPPPTSVNISVPRKKLIPSFIAGLQDFSYGESYKAIFSYFWPEFISALMLTSFLHFFDSVWVASLKSTTTYATLNVTNNFVHFMLKIAEGLTIGSVVLCGQYNGLTNYKEAGRVLRDLFWVTVLVGGVLASILFIGAPTIYALYGVPAKMVALGTPYLRLQAFRVFFMFVYLGLIGFLRGIKNTRVPMNIFILGGAVFLFFDYGLIHGAFGFPTLGLQGSACASILQYALMSVAALVYIATNKETRKYEVNFLAGISDWQNVKRLLELGFPTIVDKATFAASYIWLGSMVTSMGKYAIASFGVIKDLERFALLPAVAFAQVITFLVSNAYSLKDWDGIKSNLKKILFLSSIMVLTVLMLFCAYSKVIIPLFDHKGKFTEFSAGILPYLSMLAFFDVLQLILSGALRGAANVKTVMIVRLIICVGFFGPASYIFSRLPIEDEMLKFILIYGSFYLGNAIMSLMYIYRFRREDWKGTIV